VVVVDDDGGSGEEESLPPCSSKGCDNTQGTLRRETSEATRGKDDSHTNSATSATYRATLGKDGGSSDDTNWKRNNSPEDVATWERDGNPADASS
jgi:hypothetical protein